MDLRFEEANGSTVDVTIIVFFVGIVGGGRRIMGLCCRHNGSRRLSPEFKRKWTEREEWKLASCLRVIFQP